MKIPIFLLVPLFLCGCFSEQLHIQSLYITHEDLASVRIGTPDPRKECPDIGQRLLIKWALTDQTFCANAISLVLRIRYGDQTEKELVYDISHTRKGTMIYDLLNDQYDEHCGILSYRGEIIADGCLVEEWVHQIWTDRILFDP